MCTHLLNVNRINNDDDDDVVMMMMMLVVMVGVVMMMMMMMMIRKKESKQEVGTERQRWGLSGEEDRRKSAEAGKI